ncbi:hypothetical protein BC831DRAFT_476266 [Entophlyctis helioformis]|nr:hypothetical protein BC831DRAFT_476266 [Entophlyctis helioformis]
MACSLPCCWPLLPPISRPRGDRQFAPPICSTSSVGQAPPLALLPRSTRQQSRRHRPFSIGSLSLLDQPARQASSNSRLVHNSHHHYHPTRRLAVRPFSSGHPLNQLMLLRLVTQIPSQPPHAHATAGVSFHPAMLPQLAFSSTRTSSKTCGCCIQHS